MAKQILDEIFLELEIPQENKSNYDLIANDIYKLAIEIGINKEQYKDFIKRNISDTDEFKVKYSCYLNPLIEKTFDRIKQPNDGNCFFHTLATALKLNHDIVRRRICDYIDSHRTFFEPMISVDSSHNTFENYIKKMRLNGQYGGTPEIIAAMMMYNRPIIVYTMNGTILQSYINTIIENNISGEPIYIYACNAYSDRDPSHYELLKIKSAKLEEIKHEYDLMITNAQDRAVRKQIKEEQQHKLQIERLKQLEREQEQIKQERIKQERLEREQLEQERLAQQRAFEHWEQEKKSEELVKDMINHPDKYRLKYLKYKQKYLLLKNNF
jgi:hypothetical protein